MKISYVLAPMLAAALFTAPASAITFFSPDSALASSTSTFPVSQLVDQSGLSTTPVTLDNIGSVAHSNGIALDLWRGNAAAMPIELTFNFASSVDIAVVGLWQGFDNREGVAAFTLTFWTGPGGSGQTVGTDFDAILDSVDVGFGNVSLLGRSFVVGTRQDVSSMVMKITSIAQPLNPFVHLGEVMVASAVPEPATFGLMSIGFVGACWAARRRRAS
jgi:PEP-CTERM motif